MTALGLVMAAYLPHLLAVGVLVLGFLPGYWREEGYNAGRRFALLSWLPEQWRLPVAVVLAASCVVVAVVRSSREPVLVTCCWLYGCSFLIATPIYAWYALPFVVLVIMAGRWEWLAVWPALYVAFVFDHEVLVQAFAFGTALGVVVFVGFRRWIADRRQVLAEESSPARPENFTPGAASPSGSRVSRTKQAWLE